MSTKPPALIEQLKPGGRMAIPVSAPGGGQELMLVIRATDGTLQSRRMPEVRLVPMTGGDGAGK